VVKLEHIVCYKVLPFLLIIAASLGGVEMFYRVSFHMHGEFNYPLRRAFSKIIPFVNKS
jgi:hypothetical protein